MEINDPIPSKGLSHSPLQSNHRSKTDIAWQFASEDQDETGKKLLVCNFCQKVFRGGGINRMKQHLAGVKGNVASCVKVPEDVKFLVQGILDEKDKRTKEKLDGPRVHNLNDNEVKVQMIKPQIVHAIEGKRKATSNLQSTFKRVAYGDGNDDDVEALPPGIRVSKFDDSVENHFKLMDKIAMLSGESEHEHEQTELQRLSSSVTFLSKWRDFGYQPRAIRFACEKETSQGKDFTTRIKLPQFSSAAVPKDIPLENETSSLSSKDFVMYVGGSVWALDWCPRVHQSSTCETKAEFIAVSAHPPESSYHKIGAPLTGRGLIQIWCVLNCGQSQQGKVRPKFKPKKSSINPSKSGKPRGRPRKTPKKETDGGDQITRVSSVQSPESRNDLTVKVDTLNDGQSQQVEITPGKVKARKSDVDPTKPKRPRGRPRKTPRKEMDSGDQIMQDLEVQSPGSTNKLLQLFPVKEIDKKIKSDKSQKPKGRPRKKPLKESSNISDENSDKHVQPLTDFADDSPRTSPEPLAVAFPDKSTELNAIDKFADYTLKSFKVYTRKTKVYTKDHPAKSTWSPSKSKREKCQIRRKSQAKGANAPSLLQNCENPREQDDALPGLATGLAQSRESPLDQDNASPGIATGLAQNCENPHGQGDILPGLVTGRTQNSERPHHQDDVLPQPVTGLAQNCENPHGQGDISPGLVTARTQNSERPLDQDNVLPRPVTGLAQICERPLDQDDGLPRSVTGLPQICGSLPDQDDVLPRFVMGLAHNGKVAWNVKWRPVDSLSISNHIMGYLAVLLGNGSLEVWEVPLPRVTNAIFSSCRKEGNDPRFLKLKPVFLCSMLKRGDRQSIPLTLEWSASAPHDLILAGCHDGMVALWKFAATSSSKDTRPLLFFSADTVPIRSLKWAPLASDPESANVFATASHKGLKFWDIRDPFHPFSDIPYQKVINSLDWLPDPRCVVLSFDDGEIKIISLLKAACDTPVTGMPSEQNKKTPGSDSYYCSSSSIWSVQVSRATGLVAYCCSDGKVINFQLTTKAVEKNPQRNREPHYLCGSLTEEEDSSLTVLSPLGNIPIPMRKSSTEWADTPNTSRGVKSKSNQEKRAKHQISKSGAPPKQSSEGGAMVKNNNDATQETVTGTGTSLALVCIDNDDDECKVGEEKVEEKEKVKEEEETKGFPPKTIAMHRVSWNPNKGSGRLMCYGGASGIVRCQEICSKRSFVSWPLAKRTLHNLLDFGRTTS